MACRTVQRQKEYLTIFVSKHGCYIINFYFNIGYAGHDLTQPEFMEMLNDAKSGAFDVILAVNEDRLYRGRITNTGETPILVIISHHLNIQAKQYPAR